MLTQVVQKHPHARESNQDHLCAQTSGLSRHACSPHSSTQGSNDVSSNQPHKVHLSQEPQPAPPPPYTDLLSMNHPLLPRILLVLRCIRHTPSTSMQAALPLSPGKMLPMPESPSC
uniref:Uncharacterized protein n=1 Tax=Arundo donax TaxID=35708 RepID=A0A0A9DY54_ARUDO